MTSGFPEKFITGLLTWIENHFIIRLLPPGILTRSTNPTEAEDGKGPKEKVAVGMDVGVGRTITEESKLDIVNIGKWFSTLRFVHGLVRFTLIPFFSEKNYSLMLHYMPGSRENIRSVP